MKAIIEDTRQKVGKHALKDEYWASHGIVKFRSSLPFGDYWPAPDVAVDTKRDIVEIAMNLCGSAEETKRVTEEVKKAKNAGTKLIFLIEDSRYNEIADLYGEKIWLHNGRVIPGDQLATAMHINEQRYGCEFWFCSPGDAPRIVEDIVG